MRTSYVTGEGSFNIKWKTGVEDGEVVDLDTAQNVLTEIKKTQRGTCSKHKIMKVKKTQKHLKSKELDPLV